MSNDVLMDPNVVLAGDSTKKVAYKRDPNNVVTQLFAAQLPAIFNGFFNVHMSKGIMIVPHWHPNANEMVYMISGEATSAVFNPFTRKLMVYRLKPGQVSLLPKGWFHWIIADTDDAHMLTIFDVPTPDVVLGADFLSFMPKEVAQRAYCIDAEDYAKAVAPIKEALLLGPPPGCQLMAKEENTANKAANKEPNMPREPYGWDYAQTGYAGGVYPPGMQPQQTMAQAGYIPHGYPYPVQRPGQGAIAGAGYGNGQPLQAGSPYVYGSGPSPTGESTAGYSHHAPSPFYPGF